MRTASIVIVIISVLGLGAAHAEDRPGPTLADDLQTLKVPIKADYMKAHPRMLFGADDRGGLQAKAKNHADLWNAVLASAGRLDQKPDAESIKTGKTYWRIERVLSGALAFYVTNDASFREPAVEWMVAHCREPIWGTGFRSNLDLQASWYLYHISIAYDLLHDSLNEEERMTIRDGLTSHAKALADEFDPARLKDKLRYDQNHTYIPATALATGGSSVPASRSRKTAPSTPCTSLKASGSVGRERFRRARLDRLCPPLRERARRSASASGSCQRQ